MPVSAEPDGSRAAYASAAALQAQGLYDLAADAWREMLRAAPEGELAPRARYNLGVCQFHAGAFDEAAGQFESVADSQQFPELAEAAWANLGLAKLNAGRGRVSNPKHNPSQVEADLRAALVAFEKGEAAYPTGKQTPSNRFYRGETLALLGDHRAAAEAFRAVLASDTAKNYHRQAKLGLANALLESGATAEVSAAVEGLISDPSAPLMAAEARLLRGEARLQLETYTEAAEDFAAARGVATFTDRAYATEREAFCHYLLKDYQRSASTYDTLVAQFPDSPLAGPARVSAGKCWLLAKSPEKAAERLSQAWQAARVAANVDAALWWGRALLKLGRPGEANAAANQALAVKPAAVAPLRLLTADSLHAMEGKQAEAVDAYEQFANEWPQDPATPRALLTAATIALQLRQAEQAERLVSTLLESDADPITKTNAQAVAAAAARRQGKLDRAAALYQELATANATDERAAGWWMQVAEVHQERKRPQEALATLDQLIENFPDSPLIARAHYQRGRLRTAAGDITQANTDYAIAAQASDATLASYASLGLATNLYSAGQANACINTLETLLAQPATEVHPRARYLLATAQHATDRYQAALESLTNAEAPPADLLRLRVLCLLGLNQTADAIRGIDEFRQRFPERSEGAELLHELAWNHLDVERTEEALTIFQQVAANYPEDPLAAEASFRAGEILSGLQRHREAAVSFDKAAGLAMAAEQRDLELAEQSLHLIGWAHWNAGDREQAAAAFRKQIETSPTGALAADGRLMLGESLYALEKYADALEAFREGLEGEAANRDLVPLALLHAGQAAGQAGDWPVSLKLLERARRWVKDTPLADEAAYERAWALHQLGRGEEAAPEFDRLANQASGALAARAAFMRGELYFAGKEHEKAVRMFFRVAYGFGGREAPPEYHHWQAESLFEAARCLEQLNRVDPALKLYAELVERFPDSPKAKLANDRLSAVGPTAS